MKQIVALLLLPDIQRKNKKILRGEEDVENVFQD